MIQGMFGKRLAEHFSLLESSSLVFGPKGNSQVALTRMRMPNGFPGPTPHIPPEKAFSISVHLRRPDKIKGWGTWLDGAGARISKKPFLVECVEWVQESRSAFASVSTQPESFPWDQAQVKKTPAEKNAPPIFFQTCLQAYVPPRTALELTVAIFPLIARWNRLERIPVLGDPTLFKAEEIVNAGGYATKRSLGDDEYEVTLAKYLVHAFV